MAVSIANHMGLGATAAVTSEIQAGLGVKHQRDYTLSSAAPPMLHINTERLWNDIMHTAKWGSLPNSTGISRLALSEEDKLARQWFIAEAEKLDCEIRIDQVGNIFAILPGIDEATAPIGIGSHLDTQPSGNHRFVCSVVYLQLFALDLNRIL
jgi:hypothetical protein